MASLQGAFSLDRHASDDIFRAIDGVTRDADLRSRQILRPQLRKTTAPAQRLVIASTDDDVRIACDERDPIVTPANGVWVDWMIVDLELVRVSTVWENGRLRQSFRSAHGERSNLYSLSPDGRVLTMNVTVTSPRLRRPLAYMLVYQRV